MAFVNPNILPKDYLETRDGLVFAVLSGRPESGRFPAYLRYRQGPDGRLQKLDTPSARACLEKEFPHYLYVSESTGLELQGVSECQIRRHFCALDGTRRLLETKPVDRISRSTRTLLGHLETLGLDPLRIGVTGSLLIGAQGEHSDIDLLVREPVDFEVSRQAIRKGLETGFFQPLRQTDWREAFERRRSPLSFEEFVFHEQRKDNKALIEGIKFDLTLSEAYPEELVEVQRQLGPVMLEAIVICDSKAFSFPARYSITHPEIEEVVVFSQSYVGQARVGERIEVKGHLEETVTGRRRVVVGRDREARGDHLRLIARVGGFS